MSVLTMNPSLFHDLVIRDQQPVLVKFWAPWCIHCQNITSAVDTVAAEYVDRLTVGSVNIDDHPQLAEQYGIEYVPTFVLFNEGYTIDFVISPDGADHLRQFINDCLE